MLLDFRQERYIRHRQEAAAIGRQRDTRRAAYKDYDRLARLSVQFSYSIYVSRSLIIKIMMAELTYSSYIKKFQFQPARELSECQRCCLNFRCHVNMTGRTKQ